jgi:hypothetical protein
LQFRFIFYFSTVTSDGIKRIAVVKNGQLVGMLTEDLAMKKADLPVKTHAQK